jgi:hypothetical protein
MALTLQNAQRFCTLLSNRLPNLRKLSFNICASCDNGHGYRLVSLMEITNLQNVL